MAVFKAYDVRGTYPEQINEDLFEKIGMAIAQVLKCKVAVVGRDMRESGVGLAKAMIKGLTHAGVDVIDVGMVSTPMVYFATVFYKAGAGIQITASHNPAQYNGFKLCREEAIPVSYDSGLAEVEKLVNKNIFVPATKIGTVCNKNIESEYRANLLKYTDNIKPMTVAVDAGNGVMGAFLPALYAKMPCELIPMYFEPDGNFPNHEANPIVAKNMKDLVEKVKETGADIGVAFDGDGDRVMFVDELGNIIPADFITALVAIEMLEREPKANILYDLRSSWVCKDEIEKHGGNPFMSRVGHSYIKAMMREKNAIFAGELSGHYYFRDLSFTDNGEMAMLTVLSIVSKYGKKLSELVKPFYRYYATGEINFKVNDTKETINKIEKSFTGKAKEIINLDGLSIICEDWWCNVRPSNTEPLLRLNLEAKTPEKRDEMLAVVEKEIGGQKIQEH